MAKISATKKIAVEEFPNDVRSWLTKMIQPVNKFFEQSYFALAKGLTIADNLKAQRFDLDIPIGQTFPMRVSWTLNERPTAVLLAHIEEKLGTVIGTHSLQWTYDNGNIEVTISFSDVNASTKQYKAVLVGLV